VLKMSESSSPMATYFKNLSPSVASVFVCVFGRGVGGEVRMFFYRDMLQVWLFLQLQWSYGHGKMEEAIANLPTPLPWVCSFSLLPTMMLSFSFFFCYLISFSLLALLLLSCRFHSLFFHPLCFSLNPFPSSPSF